MKSLFLKEFKIGDPIFVVTKPANEVSGVITKLTEEYVIIKSEFYETTINLSSLLSWRKMNLSFKEADKDEPISLRKSEIIESPSEPTGSDINVITKNVKTESEQIKDHEKLITKDSNIGDKETQLPETISPPQEKDYESIPWSETGIPDIGLFKGRSEIIEKLKKHYGSSITRKQTYILYGLTRTGKSSIIEYLSKELEGKTITISGEKYKMTPFIWNFGNACANTKAEDMWNYLVEDCIITKLKTLHTKKIIDFEKISPLIEKVTSSGKYRFNTFKRLITNLKLDNLFPIILIDEFTFFATLHKSDQLDTSFLSVIRELTMKGLVSFLFAGTYDIKNLIANPEYGITGQFANTIDYEVTQIGPEAAVELINVWKSKLTLTSEAIEYILQLSNRIPYFIQIICKNIGFYALELNKWEIDYNDIEKVVKILVGESDPPVGSLIATLSDGIFLNNQYDPTESNEIKALISTICYYNKNSNKPQGIVITDIFELWDINKLTGINVLISQGLQKLKQKGIIKERQENEYCIAVDLFRRWWYLRHSDIKLELNFLEGRIS